MSLGHLDGKCRWRGNDGHPAPLPTLVPWPLSWIQAWAGEQHLHLRKEGAEGVWQGLGLFRRKGLCPLPSSLASPSPGVPESPAPWGAACRKPRPQPSPPPPAPIDRVWEGRRPPATSPCPGFLQSARLGERA